MSNTGELSVANRILAVWPGSRAEPLAVSENATFRVVAGPRPAVLRLYRPGYQDDCAIESELDWIAALRRDTAVELIEPLSAGQRIHVDPITGRRAVLFAEIAGGPVDEADLDTAHFAALGAIAAALHTHAQIWTRPRGFSRFLWDLPDLVGPQSRWGDWRAGVGMTDGHRRAVDPAAQRAAARVDAFGRSDDRFGLIHGDLRAANLIGTADRFTVIDFDDSGFGWHLFEFAAAASFVETDPRLPEWAKAWSSAYREHRDLPDEHTDLLPDFVLLRRLQLLGWLGTHRHAIESDDGFADGTVELAQRYLHGELL